MVRPTTVLSNVLAAAAAACCAMLALSAVAGDGEYEPDDHEHGAPYLGEVKDIRGLKAVQSAQIRLQIRGTQRFFLLQTDDEGRFRRSGLGADIDPESVDVTCTKAGYRTIEVMRRRLSPAKDAPVEVECLLERD